VTPFNRRRFLAATALTAGAAAWPGGTAKAAVPDRGIHDTSPASSWTDGFLTGNGEYGAVLHGAPAAEKVIFNYHRLVLPNGTRSVTPPVLAGRLIRLPAESINGPCGRLRSSGTNDRGNAMRRA